MFFSNSLIVLWCRSDCTWKYISDFYIFKARQNGRHQYAYLLCLSISILIIKMTSLLARFAPLYLISSITTYLWAGSRSCTYRLGVSIRLSHPASGFMWLRWTWAPELPSAGHYAPRFAGFLPTSKASSVSSSPVIVIKTGWISLYLVRAEPFKKKKTMNGNMQPHENFSGDVNTIKLLWLDERRALADMLGFPTIAKWSFWVFEQDSLLSKLFL